VSSGARANALRRIEDFPTRPLRLWADAGTAGSRYLRVVRKLAATDVALAAGLFLLKLVTLVGGVQESAGLISYILLPLWTLPLAWRRVRPAHVAVAVAAAALLELATVGYQTNPPDHDHGVSPREQARYLAEVVRRARQMPGVELLVWFMLRDESIDGRANFGGFQTGLVDDHNRRKPAFWTFRSLALGGS
jgi:hypothetical protein